MRSVTLRCNRTNLPENDKIDISNAHPANRIDKNYFKMSGMSILDIYAAVNRTTAQVANSVSWDSVNWDSDYWGR